MLLNDTRLLSRLARHEARLTGRQGAADGRDVREAAIPHARGGGHRCARAPGRAHAERDGRSEATLPASKDLASFLFFNGVRVWESRENVFSGLFFFIRGVLEAPSPEPTTDDTLPSPSRHDATLDDAFVFSLKKNVTSSKKGPIDVPLSDKMFAVKERALAAWPEPGPAFSKPAPPGPHAVKIILNGRVLDNGKTLKDVHVVSDAVVTCHLMVQVKHPPPSRSMVRAAGKTSESAPGCGCVVS